MYQAQASKYVLYARKSSVGEDRQVESTTNQIKVMNKLRKQGFNIVVVLEEAQSAFKPGRPIFNEAIELIKSENVDGWLCFDVNRIARNPTDAGTIIQLLSDGKLKHIQSTSASYTPKSNLIPLYLEMALAHEDSRGKSKFVKNALIQKAQRGWYPVGRIFGYYHVKPVESEGIKESIEITPEKFKAIRHLWLMALQGRTISSVHEQAQLLGLRSGGSKPVSFNCIRNMLRNEFYCGYFRWSDEDGLMRRIKGRHRPIVTEQEFLQVQRIIFEDRKPKHQRNSYNHLFRGLLTCGKCNRGIVGQRVVRTRCDQCFFKFASLNRSECPQCGRRVEDMSKSRTISPTYYSCCGRKYGCKQPYIKEEAIEDEFLKQLEGKGISKQAYELFAEVINHYGAGMEKQENHTLIPLRKRRSELENRKSRMFDLRADEEITKEDFHKKIDSIEKDLAAVDSQIQLMKNVDTSWTTTAKELARLLSKNLNNYKGLSKSSKKALFKNLGSVRQICDKKPLYTVRKPVRVIKECCEFTLTETAWVGPRESLKNMVETGKINPRCAPSCYLCAHLTKVRSAIEYEPPTYKPKTQSSWDSGISPV